MTQHHPQPAPRQGGLVHTAEACSARVHGYTALVLGILREHPASMLQADAISYIVKALLLLNASPEPRQLEEARQLIEAAAGHLRIAHVCDQMDEAVGYLNLTQADLRRWRTSLRLQAAHECARGKAITGLCHISEVSFVLGAFVQKPNGREVRP